MVESSSSSRVADCKGAIWKLLVHGLFSLQPFMGASQGGCRTSRRPVPPAAERRSEASFLIDALGPASSLSCMTTWNVAGGGLQL